MIDDAQNEVDKLESVLSHEKSNYDEINKERMRL